MSPGPRPVVLRIAFVSLLTACGGSVGGTSGAEPPSNGSTGDAQTEWPGARVDTQNEADAQSSSTDTQDGGSLAHDGAAWDTDGSSPPVSSTADGGVSSPTDPGQSAAVFDDFEATSLDARWTLRGFEGNQGPVADTAVLDTSRAHTGASSVHVHDGFLEAKAPATSFYARTYSWVAADPGTGHWMSTVALGSANDQNTEVRVGGHYDILQANYFGNDDEVISDPKGYCAPTCDNGVAMPTGRWVCMEVYYGKDELRVWLDDTEITTLHVTEWRNKQAPWSPEYDRVRVGFHNFQGQAVDVWLDDVAFDTERIGCQ